MSGARVILEVRDKGAVHRVEVDAQSDNWLDEERNKAERRNAIIGAANNILRGMSLAEIEP